LAKRDYRTVIEEISRRRSATVTVFADFCRMAACCLAMQTREEEYLEVAKRYDREELGGFAEALAYLISEMEAKPFSDILGTYYLEIASHSSKQARGEFFTPPAISQLIAGMLIDVEATKAKGEPITVYEPACGSGGMILALAELFAPGAVDLLRVTARDINPVAVDMAYINCTLWGIPARIIQGDSVRETKHREWCNLHWFRVGEPDRRRVEVMRELIASTTDRDAGDDEETSAPPPSQVDLGQVRKYVEGKNGQIWFDF
jgi:type I restriction-modification system DNA methylase subunit